MTVPAAGRCVDDPSVEGPGAHEVDRHDGHRHGRFLDVTSIVDGGNIGPVDLPERPDIAQEELPLRSARGRRWRVDASPAHTGGQALVHFAADEGTGEAAAFKVAIEPGAAGAWLDDERRLLEELAAIPALTDRVVPVIDHGTWGSRRWFAMPRYAHTLASWVATRPPPAERLSAALAVVEAVQALHAAGAGDVRYVHRDVKPTNVMRRDDGRWLLADFGAARATDPSATATSSAFHSRGFAPPEQALPIRQVPRPEWDAFACAATAYFCAVGRPAVAPTANALCLTPLGRRTLAGRDPGEASPSELLDLRRMRALDESDRAELRVVGPALVSAIEGLLEPDPARRRGDLDTLAAALRAEIAHPGAGRRGSALPFVAGAVAVVGIAGILLWPDAPAPSSRPACPEGMTPEGERVCVSPLGIRMVRAPAGPFLMGASDGEPHLGVDAPHVVRIERPFLIGEVEVTQALWQSVMGDNPVTTGRSVSAGGMHEPCASDVDGLVEPSAPVLCVSREQVDAFLRELTAREGLPAEFAWRLPTNEEWEYAARAGTTGAFPGPGDACAWGNVADASRAAVVAAAPKPEVGSAVTFRFLPCDDGTIGTAPVRRYAPNAWGLYDVVGNVSELVRTADGFGYVGSTFAHPTVRLTAGFAYPMEATSTSGGLRLARSLPPSDEVAVRRVEAPGLAPFEIGVTEVTQSEWTAVLGDTPVRDRADSFYGMPCAEDGGHTIVGDALPVVCIEWMDAVRFANARSSRDGLRPAYRIDGDAVTWDQQADGWRLPTVAEWRAALGDDGLDPLRICETANVQDRGSSVKGLSTVACDDGLPALAPVASLFPNAKQIFDLRGNAAEWAWDVVEPAPELRAVAGGGWRVPHPDGDFDVNNDYDVMGLLPDQRSKSLGVRLARNAR